ncbi:MAG: methionine adenosyltransferase [Alphaproteobacteria bacterium GM7ARS4]|nr:methionine adenosyltransferase [Alphaproteobacteria bacterium GM7ARS4]
MLAATRRSAWERCIFVSSYIFTSESVSDGHPDKLCDRVSDAIVDAYLAQDSGARIACETLATTNRVVLAGEIRSKAHIAHDGIEDIVRRVVREIGYEQEGFHWKTLQLANYLHEQSADIAQGVDRHTGEEEQGAGDQGIMFGYACDESPCLMPAPIFYAHRILHALAQARHKGALPQLRPDAKSQISLLYEDGKPVKATSVVLSSQHEESVHGDDVREMVRPYVEAALPDGWMCEEKDFHVNPTGRFVIGGPDGDTGLTGRKIIVDTYGGAAPHGGGAFSGKDPSKVDRSAAYMARYVAKNIVAAGLASRCAIQLSYAIGVARPLSVYVHSYGTSQVDDSVLAETIKNVVDLSPWGIIQRLALMRPIYEMTANYGHFGREPTQDGGFSWERTDLVKELQKAL